MRSLVPLLTALLLVSACGAEELDRSDPEAVFRAAMEAVHDADWLALVPLLTPEAQAEIERVFARLQRRLREPELGHREHAQLREQFGSRAAEEIRRVVEGGPDEALRLCTLLMPRERTPVARAVEETPRGRILLYATADGTLRPVRLVLVEGSWFVADIQL